MSADLEQLGERIAELAAHLDAAAHRLLAALREFDQRGGWHTQGALSCAHWLAWRVGWDLVTARERVRVARKLGEFPIIDDSLRRGEISYSKVRALLRIATSANEAMILEHARLTTASQLEKVSRKYARVQRHDEQHRPQDDELRRYVRRRDTDDDMVKIEAVLHPEEAELIWSMLDHAAKQLARQSDHTPLSVAPRSDSAESSPPTAAEAIDHDGATASSPARDAAPCRDSAASCRMGDSAESCARSTAVQQGDSAESCARSTAVQQGDSEESCARSKPVQQDDSAESCVMSKAGQQGDSAESCAMGTPVQQGDSAESWRSLDASLRSEASGAAEPASAGTCTSEDPAESSKVAGRVGESPLTSFAERCHAVVCGDESNAVAHRSLLDRLLDEVDADAAARTAACAAADAAAAAEHLDELPSESPVTVPLQAGAGDALHQRVDARKRVFSRADALCSIAQAYLRGDQVERAPVEVVLTIPASGLRRDANDAVDVGSVGEIHVSTAAARRMSCDAGVIEVTENEHGVPLSVGRKRRTISGSLKRALRRRDEACAFPGCTHRTYLEGHHIEHWADGGETKLDNAALLCSLCRARHKLHYAAYPVMPRSAPASTMMPLLYAA